MFVVFEMVHATNFHQGYLIQGSPNLFHVVYKISFLLAVKESRITLSKWQYFEGSATSTSVGAGGAVLIGGGYSPKMEK